MPRRILEGEVVSDRANKTVTVLVERKYMHPVYKKYIRKSDKYAAHDEHNQFKAGDAASANHIGIHAGAADVLADAVDQQNVESVERKPRHPAAGQQKEFLFPSLERFGSNGLHQRGFKARAAPGSVLAQLASKPNAAMVTSR